MIDLYYMRNNCADMRRFISYEELTHWLETMFRIANMFTDETFVITHIDIL